MTNKRWMLAAMLPLLLLLMGARQAVLVDPEPIAIPDGLTAEQISKDIKRAMITRGWTVSGEKPGHIDATLNIRTHTARVDIDWDAETIRIRYLSSDNLNYEEHPKKGRLIHGNYLGWIANLSKDISTNLQLTALD